MLTVYLPTKLVQHPPSQPELGAVLMYRPSTLVRPGHFSLSVTVPPGVPFGGRPAHNGLGSQTYTLLEWPVTVCALPALETLSRASCKGDLYRALLDDLPETPDATFARHALMTLLTGYHHPNPR